MLSSTNVSRLAVVAVAAVSLSLATGCGTTDDADSISTVPDDPTAPTSSATTITTTSVAPDTTTAPSSTAPASTAPASTAPSTTASSTTSGPATPSTGDVEVPIPAGNFDTGPSDLFVLALSGDLELWTGALTTTSGRVLVADYPDPFAVSSNGQAPNVVDQVAGEVGGTVVFGDCCEPISGNVIAATDIGDATPISGGYSPTLSPTRDLLGTANDNVITQTAADPAGVGLYRQLNQQPQSSYLNVADLTWSSNATASANDDHMVLLAWDEDGWWLHDVDRSTLEPTPKLDLGVPPVSDAPDTTMEFAGHGPNSEIVVAHGTPDTTRLRYFDPTALTELGQMERSLPGSASSIRLAGDGLGLLWVDGGSLYHLPAGDTEAVRLGTDVLAAWFS